jgi:hypothetical protein
MADFATLTPVDAARAVVGTSSDSIIDVVVAAFAQESAA